MTQRRYDARFHVGLRIASLRLSVLGIAGFVVRFDEVAAFRKDAVQSQQLFHAPQ